MLGRSGHPNTGVTVRYFSKDSDQGEIMEFLIENNLPTTKKDSVVFKENGVITINDISDEICKELVANLNGKLYKGKNLQCKGIVPLTPEKVLESNNSCTTEPILPVKAISENQSHISSFADARKIFENPEFIQPSAADIVRRHSISIINRTPPKNSIAEDLLQTESRRHSLLRSASLLEEVKDLTEQLSEFGSCISSDESDKESFTSVNEKFSNKKKKRKLKVTPQKKEFLKKSKGN